ncbi:hypothetical protein BT96DRAFT_999469 [Gymnopus androsaceus JB14]|uniref:Uncharacterized protein n=1 Tax=Gymnopus androsaceus JB14 TaxID=1447944 RepID=A0A6A4H6T0_9AGAR|nr:hypothetical protein BT96DRAFT_999469 [Gymnopus androsaceus JB14]
MDELECRACMLGKASRYPIAQVRSSPHAENFGDVFHMDVWGPSQVRTVNHCTYTLTLVDKATDWLEEPQMKSEGRVIRTIKMEGNALFAANKYAEGEAKYTEAIEVGGDNAILYANRAACKAQLKRYLASATDAKKATQLEPAYPKAHTQLAQAQMMIVQKTEYDKGLSDATTLVATEIAQGDYTSSAYTIVKTADNFEQGINLLLYEPDTNTVRAYLHLCSGFAYRASYYLGFDLALGRHPRGLLSLSYSRRTLYKKFREYVDGEIQRYNAWSELISVDDIKKEVFHRLQEEGPDAWETLRPGLSVTVRALVMHGFHQEEFFRAGWYQLEYFNRAVEIIKWGREQWKDLPMNIRG